MSQAQAFHQLANETGVEGMTGDAGAVQSSYFFLSLRSLNEIEQMTLLN